jgi:septum formation protein
MTMLKALERLNAFDIILASKSPRRQQLLAGTGLKFRTVNNTEIDEVFPAVLKREEIPLYLAQAKAVSFYPLIGPNTILITADTIVWLNDEVIGKPADYEDSVNMLMKLSGNMHEVFTGVCIKTSTQEKLFYASTRVFFRKITGEEIRYYVDAYKPYDKAGSYGVQEWIGYVGVERIEGSFYNVMGLPVQMLYHELLNIVE